MCEAHFHSSRVNNLEGDAQPSMGQRSLSSGDSVLINRLVNTPNKD